MIHLNDTPGFQRVVLNRLGGKPYAKAFVDGEAFWLRDVKLSGEVSDVYVGVIDNKLLFTGIHGLDLDDRVSFTPSKLYHPSPDRSDDGS